MVDDSVDIIDGTGMEEQTVIIGFPDVGLVGLITSMHIVET